MDVELTTTDNRLNSVSVSGMWLDDGNAGDEQTGQLLPQNTTDHASSEELPVSSGAGAAEINGENSSSRLRAENAKLREEIIQLKQENQNQQNQQMWAEINRLRLEFQRLSSPSVAPDSEDARAKLAAHIARAADAADGRQHSIFERP